MKKLATVTVLLTVMSSGCATHHTMSEAGESIAVSTLGATATERAQLERAITDGDIAKLLDAKVRAKLPTTLAVAKLKTGYGHGYRYQSIPGLETRGTEELDSWEKVVADEPLITGVQPIAALAVRKPKEEERFTLLRALREAAARQNCELLLVYVQDDRCLENLNDAAILYWTVIGLWLVPGTEIEHRTIMQAVLVDCRTGTILGTATGEDHPKRTYPAAFTGIKHDKLAAQTAEKSLQDLQVGCRKLLGKVVAASRTARR